MSKTTETLSLKIVRQFDVGPEVVFDTFTKPELMRVWWTDQTTFDIDLRVGGCWTIIRREEDTEYIATGEYLEIEQPHRLQYTYAMPQFSPNSDTIAIMIIPEQTGCVVTFVQSGEDIASELQTLLPGTASASEEGWQQAFDLMATAWRKTR